MISLQDFHHLQDHLNCASPVELLRIVVFCLPFVRTDLLEVEAVRDVVRSHEGSQQMGDGAGLTAVRPEGERVHPPLSGKQKINKCCILRTRVLRGTYHPVIVKYALTEYLQGRRDIKK